MKKTLIKIRNGVLHVLILVVIFVAAVAGFERWINQTTPTIAEGMESSSFPLLYIVEDGVSYNCLHGYAYEMDVNYIRDTITVLGSDHLLELQIQPFTTSVEGISYEVLTTDGRESLENTNVVNMTEENGYLYTTLELQNYMLMNQEYILKVKVSAGGRDIFFYTRLILEDGLHLSSYLDFVSGFYEKCVNKTDQETLGTYVEPDESSGEATTLAAMDIHDSVNQLMWGSLNPQIYYKPTPSLVDINETTASFVLEYRISAIGEGGETELYNIKEFYRLRYTDTRVFLLDFTRTTDEIFQTDGEVIQSNGINLGITDMDVEYQFSESARMVAFVQENELWTYSISGDKLTRVFGFPQSENMDYRDFYDKNTIKILRIDNEGNVWFAVSGYMNRGAHEGENGVAVCYYEEASATVDEFVFIRTMESYDMLKLDTDTLAYVTENQQYFYVLLEGVIYRVDLQSREYEAVVEDIKNNCYVSSSANQYFAWLKEGREYDSETVCIINLETGEIREISGNGSERLRPVAFMGDDFVYGAALCSDIDNAHAGNEVFPMYRLTILNTEGETVKTYQPDGYYVMEVSGSDTMLTLTRAVRGADGYEEASEDHIVSTEGEESAAYGVSTQISDTKQTEIILRFGTSVGNSDHQVVTSKMLSRDTSRYIYVSPNEEREELYYVYAGGSMVSRHTSAAPAIREADENVGVVINQEKQFVWERGNRPTTKQISLDKIPAAFRTGVIDAAALQETMGDGVDVLDLTGCTLDMVLYFVGQNIPVLANTPSGVVTIAGYDEYNVILLDPGSEETYYGGLQDSTAMFEEAGNQFVAYLEKE